MSGLIKKEDGSISIFKLVGLAVVVSITVSIVASVIGNLFDCKCCPSNNEDE